MLQADIDLLQQDDRDTYFFALRLISLTKNKKKPLKHVKNSHFKFVVEQNDYVIDQTRNPIENIFWMIKTTMISLNKQLLNFTLSDTTQTNTQFQLKLYLISHQQVKQVTQMNIQTLTYVEVFLQCGKTVFRQTVSICPDYTLEYEIYVHKSQIDLSNLIKDSDDEIIGMKNAFKKKTHQVIEIQNQKVQIKPKARYVEDILRKSLTMNVNKLMEIKKRNREIKDRSMSKNGSTNSIFSQIGDIFRSKSSQTVQPVKNTFTQSLLNAARNKQKLKKQNKKVTDQDRSFSICPPWIDQNRYNRDQSMSEEDSLKILRQKSRLRQQKHEKSGLKQTSKHQFRGKAYLKMLMAVILILMLAFLFYYFSSVGKKGRYRWWKPFEKFLNVK